MENFYSWMIKPVSNDDVEIWFNMNNMVPEKRELFSDFTFSLYFLIRDTYLGDEFSQTQETKVILSEEEKKNHFDWCWKKTIDNFSKEKEKRITTNLFDSSIIYKLDFQNYSLVPSEILPFVFVSDFNMV